MKILFLTLAFVVAYAEFDPFDYGENFSNSGELKLYGIMDKRANFNGKWYKIHTALEAQNVRFRIVKIQNSCVFLQEINSQKQSKICLQESKLLRN